jgi:catechol 2,3-dioxygenase-like lactoylglutathione lyase family enzyme
MEHTRGECAGLVSRRQALVLLGAVAATHGAAAAEPALMHPVSLDHVNIRVSSVARSAAFYMGLFDTPVLRNPALRAQPNSPPSEGFFLQFGDGYLAISQMFSPDLAGLDHYSLGLRDYDKARLETKLRENGIAVPPRSSSDLWLSDLDGSLMQLRPPGGWARQTATTYQGPVRVGPALSPLSISRIALLCADVARAGDYYNQLFGTEIVSVASSRSRVFSIGDSILELVSASPDSSSSRRGMDYLRIAVRNFNAEAVGRVLRERGIASTAVPGALRISDPDGIRIELAAAS